MGSEAVPEITEQELVRLLQAERHATQVEIVKQLQGALDEFSEQLQVHLDERQKQANAQLALIYQGLQSQRVQDLELIRQELQHLAGATEAEFLETQRAFEFILASHVSGIQAEYEMTSCKLSTVYCVKRETPNVRGFTYSFTPIQREDAIMKFYMTLIIAMLWRRLGSLCTLSAQDED